LDNHQKESTWQAQTYLAPSNFTAKNILIYRCLKYFCRQFLPFILTGQQKWQPKHFPKFSTHKTIATPHCFEGRYPALVGPLVGHGKGAASFWSKR
jgi:hypothetical protein